VLALVGTVVTDDTSIECTGSEVATVATGVGTPSVWTGKHQSGMTVTVAGQFDSNDGLDETGANGGQQDRLTNVVTWLKAVRFLRRMSRFCWEIRSAYQSPGSEVHATNLCRFCRGQHKRP
jgi:hypothetical protein